MNNRERLVELLEESENKCNKQDCEMCKYQPLTYNCHHTMVADHLIANGVIVPPCKVGETLYFLYDRPYANRPNLTPYIYETNQWYFDVNEKGISILPRSIHGYKGKYHYYLGETVFLTKEEAEKKLKEREGE